MDKNKVITPQIRHGGNLAQASKRFGPPKEGWLDLSTGINPSPYPSDRITFSNLDRLPDPTDQSKLLSAAREYFSCPKQTGIVAAPGTQMILQWLPRLFNQSSIAIVEPTYGEHRATWTLAGHDIVGCKNIEEAESKASMVVVVNPNNPDGTQYANDQLLALAGRLHERGGLLVVDGAFEDVLEQQPMSTLSGPEGLVVLRSFGKFFGLAGIRLGFALCHQNLATKLESFLGPWAVSQPAIAAGCAAMTDKIWIKETQEHLQKSTKELDQLLESVSLNIIGGTTLFRLVEMANADKLYQHLGKAGILVRPFDENPNWLRFGLPGNVKNIKRLREALESFAKSV